MESFYECPEYVSRVSVVPIAISGFGRHLGLADRLAHHLDLM